MGSTVDYVIKLKLQTSRSKVGSISETSHLYLSREDDRPDQTSKYMSYRADEVNFLFALVPNPALDHLRRKDVA
jgi:hypothetical protein